MKKYAVLFLSLLPLAVIGCATSQDVEQVERQTASISAELREAKGDLDQINYNLQAQNKKMKEVSDSVQYGIPPLAEKIKAISDDLTVIKRNQADLSSRAFTGGGAAGVTEGRLDELQHEISSVNAKLDGLKAALLQRISELEKSQSAPAQQTQPVIIPSSGQPEKPSAAASGQATAPSGPSGGSQSQPAAAPQTQASPAEGAAPTAGDPNQMYQAAYLDFTKGNYDVAVAEFQEFLRAYPDAEFAGNAQYWIGESLYSQGKYNEALAEFDKVINNYPDSTKVPGAMLKKGYTLDALKRPSDAEAVYNSLIKKFPASEAAKLASERLKSRQ
ncbi:MAG: tol-pal system protein YbgF [Nitrospirota bacterium]